jgi:hypothetical protein
VSALHDQYQLPPVENPTGGAAGVICHHQVKIKTSAPRQLRGPFDFPFGFAWGFGETGQARVSAAHLQYELRCTSIRFPFSFG